MQAIGYTCMKCYGYNCLKIYPRTKNILQILAKMGISLADELLVSPVYLALFTGLIFSPFLTFVSVR